MKEKVKCKKILQLLLIAIILIFLGCSNTELINIDIDIKWGGLKDIISINKDKQNIGVSDEKEFYIVIKNNEEIYLDGIYLKVYPINLEPTISVYPPLSRVIKLGPKGDSSRRPNRFVIRTNNTPPGEYKFRIDAIYKGMKIGSKQFTIVVK
ncbi:MAG: hypothetical protein GXN98_00615 [Euryarchaeota archaeon]|nr:hypothetical protein [Euryarchaeota archaeon]